MESGSHPHGLRTCCRSVPASSPVVVFPLGVSCEKRRNEDAPGGPEQTVVRNPSPQEPARDDGMPSTGHEAVSVPHVVILVNFELALTGFYRLEN